MKNQIFIATMRRRITTFFLTAIFLLFSFLMRAQKVTGKWYGIGNADVQQNTNNYLCEFILQQNGNIVTGEFNYYFRNGYFSNKVKGVYNANTRKLYIRFIPIIYYASVNTLNGVDVSMKGEFVLRVSQAGSFLSGAFVSDDAHKYACKPIKINFQKRPYNEPTLKEQFGVMKPLLIDTTQEIAVTGTNKATAAPPLAVPSKNLTKQTEEEVKRRLNRYIRTLEVTDDSVRIDLYDNAEFDYDTLSIFYDNKLIEFKKLLDIKKPVTFYVKVDANETKNDITMFAENLGLIPPNAALMVVRDSENRYEISLESNYSQNAIVRLRKKYKAILQTNSELR